MVQSGSAVRASGCPAALPATRMASGRPSTTASSSALVLVPVVLAFIFYFVAVKFGTALILRITTNNTTIVAESGAASRHTLGADWSLPGMLWIYLTNLFLLILSFGLLTPWAQIRILKYQLEHSWIEPATDIDEVVAVQANSVSSLGEEIGDVFDIDIGF